MEYDIKIEQKDFKSNKMLSFSNIMTYLLIIIFVVRLFCYETKITDFIGLKSSIINPVLTFFTLIFIWFNYTAILILIMRKFFNFKTIKNLCKYMTLPIFIINCGLFYPTIMLFQKDFKISVLMIVYLVELLISLGLNIYYFIKDLKEKPSKKDILLMFGIFGLMLIASMPSYLPQFIFGNIKAAILIKDISPFHRLFIYIGIIVPILLYFSLRNKPEEVIRFSLIYISIAVLIGFLVNYDYTNFLEPWTWPFHLCNTALFIIPLCLIFKMKRLFYFTYFINVFGALIAMLMPNYDALTNILSMRIFNFWYNHWIAFFMPILIVALKQFKRPTVKEFSWSMLWFLGYFILVLVLNVVFTAMGHTDVDYFFINSNYVADKLGNWAEKLFNIKSVINIGNYNFEFHPIYQALFFLTYVLLGLGVWFIYVEFFRIADSHYALHMKLKENKLAQSTNFIDLVRGNMPSKERRESMKDIKATLKLNNFSKKYATSKVYAVHNASLEVNEGEIFGFLGPNGAGKSTIIKSIVGIQPITEGNIEICGFDIKKNPIDAKFNIGYVPDHYALYEKLTGREYINYIADIYEVSQEERDERIEKYIKLFELEHSIDSKIKTYSHGMKQKITIISALVHNPKVWILDEPLTGLDPNSIYQVKECMREHASKGNIVFFSSHLIDIVERLCEKIAIIKHGKIECIKKVKDIEKEYPSLEEFYLQIIGNNEGNNDETA